MVIIDGEINDEQKQDGMKKRQGGTDRHDLDWVSDKFSLKH